MSKSKIATANAEVDQIDELKAATMAHTDTAKKIRYLLAQGKTIKETYHLINSYGVTTKGGGEIRYQHVFNTAHQKLTK